MIGSIHSEKTSSELIFRERIKLEVRQGAASLISLNWASIVLQFDWLVLRDQSWIWRATQQNCTSFF